MKKLFTFAAVMALFVSASFAGTAYKLDDQKVEALFASSNDITMTASADALTQFASNGISQVTAGDKTVGGFLLRAWFCGFIALHRSYMGTGGKTLWYYYFCIPVAGSVVGCVDFWYVVFKGQEGLSKYADNPEWVVWN